MKTRIQLAIALATATGILALTVAISPHPAIIANAVSGEVQEIDILGLTKAAGNLPEQQFVAP